MLLIESQQASARILKKGPDFLFFDYCNTSIRANFGMMALEMGLGDGVKTRLVDGAPGGRHPVCCCRDTEMQWIPKCGVVIRKCIGCKGGLWKDWKVE